jgi:hypothetical protein
MKNQIDKKVSDWNVAHPVGTPVEYTDGGDATKTITTSEAMIMGGTTAVIGLEGFAGYCHLDRVTALVATSNQASEEAQPATASKPEKSKTKTKAA